MCVRTLKNRLRDYQLRRRMAPYDIDFVREKVRQEINGPACMAGYRSVWHALRLDNVQVPRRVVAGLMGQLDPEGCQLRKARRLQRRRYTSPGPNYVWHVDGYDKLKPYGFPIHGCIDGWSRKLMWLKVTRSNNHPDIVANFYLDCVSIVGGCPVKLRTDCGTENGVMAAMQCTFREDVDAHKYGTSPANQRIEGWWSFYKRNRSTWWINFFKDLMEQETFNPGNELQMECLWFCFSHLLQADLNKVREHWNTHYIRSSRYDTISGRPNKLYFFPELHGGEDNLLLPVTGEQLDSIGENLTYKEEESVHKEYFEYVLSNSNLQPASNHQEALNLYQRLLHIAGTND